MPESLAPRHVLALAPNWLGDVAMCTPALRALKNRFPEATLSVAGRGGACALLKGIPWIDALHVLPAPGGMSAFFKTVRAMRAGRPDLVVAFPHSFRAALAARLSGAKTRVGYDRDNRRALLTEVVDPHRVNGVITPIYMTTEYLNLLKPLGCADDGRALELVAEKRAIAAFREHLPEGGPLVGFAPGAAFGPSKCWLPDRYAAVADLLTEQAGARCVLLTGPGEERTRDAVQEAARTKLLICDEGQPTIDSLKAAISQLDLLVCNDSGPRHVAVAFGVPTICVMGSTRPAYSCGPYERGEVIRIDVDCGPCQKPLCATDHRCMTGISTDRVAEAAMAYLPQARVR